MRNEALHCCAAPQTRRRNKWQSLREKFARKKSKKPKLINKKYIKKKNDGNNQTKEENIVLWVLAETKEARGTTMQRKISAF